LWYYNRVGYIFGGVMMENIENLKKAVDYLENAIFNNETGIPGSETRKKASELFHQLGLLENELTK
jgi:hypothetical protein